MMATFLIDYAKLLIKRFPIEAKELSTLHEKMVQKDELQKGQWRYRNLQKITIRQKSNKKNGITYSQTITVPDIRPFGKQREPTSHAIHSYAYACIY